MSEPLPPFLDAVAGGTRLRVKVQPRARKNAVGTAETGELEVWVTAPPVDSAANEAVCELMAEKLECRRGAVQLIQGGTSRHKVLLIAGLTPEQVLARLQESE